MIAFLHFCEPGAADGFLSPYFRAAIAYRGHSFGSATHLMAYLEARFFGDAVAEGHVRMASAPRALHAAASKIRRSVVLEQAWQYQQLREIAFAQRLKFEQHPELARQLANIGDALLCYANPAERVLGIGIADTHPHACQPHRWPGLNQLGVALSSVRAEFARRGTLANETAIAV